MVNCSVLIQRMFVNVYRLVSLAAKAFFVCLDTKEAKNQVSQNASLPHVAFTLQNKQNLGWNLFALLRTLNSNASAKISYALQPHKAIIVLPVFA